MIFFSTYSGTKKFHFQKTIKKFRKQRKKFKMKKSSEVRKSWENELAFVGSKTSILSNFLTYFSPEIHKKCTKTASKTVQNRNDGKERSSIFNLTNFFTMKEIQSFYFEL